MCLRVKDDDEDDILITSLAGLVKRGKEGKSGVPMTNTCLVCVKT